MRHGDWAWLALAGGVCAYEAYAAYSKAELLSEACDRYRERHLILTHTVIVYLAGHRKVPQRIDPLHRMAARR